MIKHINGWRVVIKEPDLIKVKRTWKERLFTLPFSPFKKFKQENFELIKDGEILQDKINMIMYVNNKTFLDIEKVFNNDK